MDSILERLRSKNEDDMLDALNEVMINCKPEYIKEVINILINEKSNILRESASDVLKFVDIDNHFDEIAKMFESTDAYIRNVAIEIFGAKGESAVPFLTSIMDHKNKEVRKLILDSLVSTGSEYAIPALEAGLEDPDINVKITAVEYLGTLGSKSSKDKVVKLLKESNDSMLIITCLETLNEIGDTQVLEEILKIFNVEEDRLENFYKPFVFKLIAKFGNKEHLPLLLKYLNYKNLSLLDDILFSLKVLIKRNNIKSIDKEKISFIKQIINSEDANNELVSQALELLIQIDFEDKKLFLEGLTEHRYEDVIFMVYDYLYDIDKDWVLRDLKKKIKLSENLKRELYNKIAIGLGLEEL